jgi:hypothetical protein
MKYKIVLLLLALALSIASMAQPPKFCKGITKKGAPCKAYAMQGSEFCRTHNPEAFHCGAITKAGKPCQIVVKAQGAHCYRHQ